MHSDIKTLAGACRAFRHEYGVWPIPSSVDQSAYGFSNWLSGVTGSEPNKDVIAELKDDPAGPRNVRRIRFLNLGDYLRDNDGNVICPTNKNFKYRFFFNVDADTNAVY
jgi:hypothetical protein